MPENAKQKKGNTPDTLSTEEVALLCRYVSILLEWADEREKKS